MCGCTAYQTRFLTSCFVSELLNNKISKVLADITKISCTSNLEDWLNNWLSVFIS